MNIRAQSLVLMVLGTLVLTVSVLADAIGLGANPATIGWKQYSGASVGLAIALMGAHLAFHHAIRK